MSGEEHALCILAPLAAQTSSSTALWSSKQQESFPETLLSTATEDAAQQVAHVRTTSCLKMPERVLLSQHSASAVYSSASMATTAVCTSSSHEQHCLQDTVAVSAFQSSNCPQQQCLQEAVAAAKASAAPTDPPLHAGQPIHMHHHRHKHRQRHHHHHHYRHHQQEEQQPCTVLAERTVSAYELHSIDAAGSSSRSHSPSLVAVVEERRPKSFTAGQRHRQPKHGQFPNHSSPGNCSQFQLHNGTCHSSLASTRTYQTHTCTMQQQQHVPAHGRRSPLLLHHTALLSQQQQHAGHVGYTHVCATDGSFTGLQQHVATHGRVMAEFVKPKAIAKGFAGHWLSRRCIDVFTGSRVKAAAAVLQGLLPAGPGLHLWLVRPPRSRCWVPIHLAAADNLQVMAGQYLHGDGSCGPAADAEPFKSKVFMDLLCRGFAVQLRFRPMKPKAGSLADDLLSKLRLFDFPLNDKDNGGCRPIELPNGWQVAEYPITVAWMNGLYEHKFGPRRMMLM